MTRISNSEDIGMVIKKVLGATGVIGASLYDYDWFSDTKGEIELGRLLLPYVLVDPTGPDIPQYFDGDQIKIRGSVQELIKTAPSNDFEDTAMSAGTNTKDRTVPANKTWEILHVFSENPDAAGRVLQINAHDSSNNQIARMAVGDTIDAGHYLAWPGGTFNAGGDDASINGPIILGAGDYIRLSWSGMTGSNNAQNNVMYVERDATF